MPNTGAAQPDWSDFRFFLALARNGRLLSASRALGVQHTTVARRIDALEAALGSRLFHRTTRGWLLTQLGQRMLEHAANMEREAQQATARARQESADLRGRVRVATVDSWAYAWLVPHLPALHAQSPNIQIELLTGNSALDLTRGQADLALRTPRPKQRELSAVCIAEGGIGIFARRDLAQKHRAAFATHPPNGAGVPLGIYSDEVAFLQRAPWFGAFAAAADVRLVSTSTATLLAAARRGYLAVVIPRMVVRNDGSLVELTRAPVTWQRIWLVTHPDVRRDPRVQAVSRFIRSIAADIDERPRGAAARGTD